MRPLLYVALLTGLSGTITAGAISYQAQPIGQPTSTGSGVAYRLTFDVQGFTLNAGYELDIRFDPANYISLSNATGPAGFDILLLQPNSPPGAFGDFSALALSNSSASPLTFSVNVVAIGQPASHRFVLNQLDSRGVIVRALDAGFTVAADVPEPGTLGLTCLALLIVGLAHAKRAGLRRG